MYQLDVKDRKLLYFLSLGGRSPASSLSKSVGLSRSAVEYRIQRLEKEGIIQNFSAVINTAALGHTSFSMLIKLSTSKTKDVFKYFASHPFSLWVISLSGTYDVFVEFATRDVYHLAEIVREVKERLTESLNYYEVHLIEESLKVEHLIKDIYEGLDVRNVHTEGRAYTKRKLDVLDKNILRILSQQSRMKLTDIAQSIGSTWDVVRYRMKQMKDAGVVIKYFPEINLKRLGYMEFLCKISLHNYDGAAFKQLKYQIKENGNITYAFVNVNAMDIIISCAFEKISGLDNFLLGIQNSFKKCITRIDYFIVRETLKFDLFPEGLLAK